MWTVTLENNDVHEVTIETEAGACSNIRCSRSLSPSESVLVVVDVHHGDDEFTIDRFCSVQCLAEGFGLTR